MSELTFNIGGRIVPASEIGKYATPAPKKASRSYVKRVTDRSLAKLSDGFLVTGYSPAHIEMAKVDHERLQKTQADLIAVGAKLGPREKIVRDWDQEAWMSATKPKRVRSKPYEISSSADQCAELARKAGWLRVSVEEIMKG